MHRVIILAPCSFESKSRKCALIELQRSINGQNVYDASYNTVVSALTSHEVIDLVLAPELRVAVIDRTKGGPLGKSMKSRVISVNYLKLTFVRYHRTSGGARF